MADGTHKNKSSKSMTGPWFLDYEHEEEIAVLLKRYGQSLERKGTLILCWWVSATGGDDDIDVFDVKRLFYFPSSSS